MASEVTTEVVNESDGEVVLKRSGAAVFILTELTGRGDRFTIKTDPKATYMEYILVGTSTSGAGSSFVMSSDECIENERIVIRKDRAVEGNLRLDKIKRGMSVTEVVNDTDLDFDVKNGIKVVEVLKARNEYLIQRDPKGKFETQQYSLVSREKPAILIPTDDLVNNQRLTVSGEDNPAVTNKIPTGVYLTEVFNKTETSLKVLKSEPLVGSRAFREMVTLQGDGSQSFTIEYDPGSKDEYWVQLMTLPLKEHLLIPPEYFVKGKWIYIMPDSTCSAGFKLVSAEPRPVPTPTSKHGILSSIAEFIGFRGV